ncbi:MAG: hypothetical protein H0V55_07340, partial [Thermoleophilaceae bacterium]|nr:hypothetical protein [Thermoleophilaceae bacterium]
MAPGGGDLMEQGFQSFWEATRSILGLLEKRLPGSLVFVAHLDGADGVLRIVDATAGDGSVAVEPGQSVPLDASLCFHMASRRAPQLSGDAAADPVYGPLAARR